MFDFIKLDTRRYLIPRCLAHYNHTSVVRLGGQAARIGTRNYHPNSPGDKLSARPVTQKVMKIQSNMLEQYNSGKETYHLYDFKDAWLYNFTLATTMLIMFSGMFAYTKAAKIKFTVD